MHTPCSLRGCWLEYLIRMFFVQTSMLPRLRNCTQPLKFRIDHSIGQTHSGRICIFIKILKNVSCEYDCIPGILLYCGHVNFGAVLPLSVLSYLNERWKDKSTSSILAAGCPPRLKLYPPAFAADLSSTMRLRSISSLP